MLFVRKDESLNLNLEIIPSSYHATKDKQWKEEDGRRGWEWCGIKDKIFSLSPLFFPLPLSLYRIFQVSRKTKHML